MILAMLALAGVAVVLAGSPPVPLPVQEDTVPLYAPEDAWRLALAPESRMVDANTCERVEGTFRVDENGRRQVIAGARTALFRKDRPRTPFMRVQTREDGVYVARFPARPNEAIVARGFVLDPYTRRFIYGAPFESTCREPKVHVGEVLPGR